MCMYVHRMGERGRGRKRERERMFITCTNVCSQNSFSKFM